jgi:hypothetical protein
MTLRTYPDLLQGSEEWLAKRRGIVTASIVGQLIATRTLTAIDHPCPACSADANDPCRSKVKDGAVIKTPHSERTEFAREQNVVVIEPARGDVARSLTLLLAAERITGWTDPTFISDDMMRGIDDEPIVRAKYAEHYAPVAEEGFMVEDRWGFKIGYSPDGLVGDDGLIEIKSRRSKVQLATVLADEVPAENMAQLQCGLLVSGRKWIDYVSYCAGMPLWTKRVYPQRKWFDAIIASVSAFEDNATEFMRTYGESIVGLPMTERSVFQEIRVI